MTPDARCSAHAQTRSPALTLLVVWIVACTSGGSSDDASGGTSGGDITDAGSAVETGTAADGGTDTDIADTGTAEAGTSGGTSEGTGEGTGEGTSEGTSGGGPVEVPALPDDAGLATFIASADPQVFRSDDAIVSSGSFSNVYKHNPTQDSGSWLFDWNLGGVAVGSTWMTFALIDQDITQEIALTDDALVGYFFPTNDTVLEVEVLEVGASEPARYLVDFTQQDQWSKVAISEDLLTMAGLDLGNIESISVRASKGISSDVADVYLSMVKGP